MLTDACISPLREPVEVWRDGFQVGELETETLDGLDTYFILKVRRGNRVVGIPISPPVVDDHEDYGTGLQFLFRDLIEVLITRLERYA